MSNINPSNILGSWWRGEANDHYIYSELGEPVAKIAYSYSADVWGWDIFFNAMGHPIQWRGASTTFNDAKNECEDNLYVLGFSFRKYMPARLQEGFHPFKLNV